MFLHIPKTAGMTMRRFLVRQYGVDEIFATAWGGKARSDDGSLSIGMFVEEFGAAGIFIGVRYTEAIWFPESLQAAASRFHQLPNERRVRVRLLYGKHVEFGLHEYLSQQISYFTLLREPVDRVLSHYHFARERRLVPKGMSLHEHISAHVESNLQTRMLAGLSGRNGLPAPAEMLERAKDNLRSCAVVGLAERFDETMLLLRETFGWRTPFYERRNIGRHRLSRKAIEADTLRRIAADNQLDVALYEYARELFEVQVRRCNSTRQRDLRIFQTLNFLWQRRQAGKRLLREAMVTLNQCIVDPVYWALARWGGLHRLLPSRLAPRVVTEAAGNRLYIDLRIGRRVVGNYDPQQQRWQIQRPFHLLVDERTLPGVAEKTPT